MIHLSVRTIQEELLHVMNEKTSETLAGYIVGIQSNKEVLDLSPTVMKGS